MDQAALNQIFVAQRELRRELTQVRADYKAFLEASKGRPMTVQDQVNTIPGRRIPYMLNQVQSFTASDAQTRAPAMNFLVSQDGPFILTHYPLVCWRPNAPSNATNFGRWSPIASFPLPATQLGTSQDIIDISFEVVDGGTQRNYQNMASGPGPLSRPDNIVPLPEWSVIAPNSVLQFVPTYEAINFAAAPAVDTTGGLLFVSFPGFRIVTV